MTRPRRGGWLALGLLVFAASSVARAKRAPPRPHGPGPGHGLGLGLGLMTSFTPSPEPLTTADVVQLDPGRPNAYLARWVLSRDVQLKGLVTVRLGKGRVGVRARYLDASATSRMRAPGSGWYQDFSRFPCRAVGPDPAFATLDETREVVSQADRLWNRILQDGIPQLSIQLSDIAAPGPLLARAKAQRVFLEWLDRADKEWRAEVAGVLSAREWSTYRAQARAAGLCVGTGSRRRESRISSSAHPFLKPVETAPASPTGSTPASPGTKPSSLPSLGSAVQAVAREPSMIRAPSRRWDGYFAVRADVVVGDHALNGQFVIDPGAPTTILAPSWLESQGAEPEWLEFREMPPPRARITAGTGDTGLARAAWVQALKVSGKVLDLQHVLIFDSAGIFDQPDFVSSCCSGVLGLDLLRQYAVEFHPGPPTEVGLWPIKDFQPPAGYVGAEVRELVSEKGGFQVFCGGAVARFRAKLCQDPIRAIQAASFPVILDLPDGRIWYSPAELQTPLHERNRTGVRLAYGFVQGGDRVLRVEALGGTRAARALEREGLKKGTVITEVDGQPSTDLDIWQIRRRLAGANGTRVTLRWKTPYGEKMVPLRVDGGPP